MPENVAIAVMLLSGSIAIVAVLVIRLYFLLGRIEKLCKPHSEPASLQVNFGKPQIKGENK